MAKNIRSSVGRRSLALVAVTQAQSLVAPPNVQGFDWCGEGRVCSYYPAFRYKGQTR